MFTMTRDASKSVEKDQERLWVALGAEGLRTDRVPIFIGRAAGWERIAGYGFQVAGQWALAWAIQFGSFGGVRVEVWIGEQLTLIKEIQVKTSEIRHGKMLHESLGKAWNQRAIHEFIEGKLSEAFNIEQETLRGEASRRAGKSRG